MARTKYYSPPLDRDLVSLLYHLAQERGVPMTRLASTLVREGLTRLAIDEELLLEFGPRCSPKA